MSYLGYEKRERRQNIDWNAISSAVSTNLQEEKTKREDLKRSIDDASQGLGTTISKSPQGQKISANQWVTEAAGQFSKARLMYDRKLKSGEMSLDDYRMRVQNLRDSVDYTYEVMKSKQDAYAESLERVNNGTASQREIWEKENAERFANLQDTGLFIDPESGRGFISKYQRGPDGALVKSMSKNPNEQSDLSSLAGKFSAKYDSYDVGKELQGGVEMLGKDVEFVAKKGTYGTIDDIMASDRYKDAESSYINRMFANPDNGGHILVDFVAKTPDGEEYGYTYDPDEAKKDPSKIFVGPDPENPSSGRMVAQLSDEQEKIAKDVLTKKMRSMIDREYNLRGRYPSPSTASNTSSSDRKYARGVKQSADTLSNLAQLYYGNEEGMETAEQFIVGASGGEIKSVNRSPQGVSITKKDGTTVNLNFQNPDGTVKSQEDFLKGAANFLFDGMGDIEAILDQTQYDPNQPFNDQADIGFKVGEALTKLSESVIETAGIEVDAYEFLRALPEKGIFTSNKSVYSKTKKRFDDFMRMSLPSEVYSQVDAKVSDDGIMTFNFPGIKPMSIDLGSVDPLENANEIIAKFEPFYNAITELSENSNRPNRSTPKPSPQPTAKPAKTTMGNGNTR